MALTHHREGHEVAYGTEVDEQVRTRDRSGLNTALRAIGAVASAVPLVISLIALVRLDWGQGVNAPAVDVAGMAFTPVVAIATLVVALVSLAAAAAPDRAGKIAVGAVLTCGGLAILLAGSSRADLDLETGHGWMALVVGVVLLVTGLAIRYGWSVERRRVTA